MTKVLNYSAYDKASGLNLQAKVYNMSGSPSLASTVTLAHVINGSYSGIYTADPYTPYLVTIAVYTDGTFTDLHADYSPSSESIDPATRITLKKNVAQLYVFPMYDMGGALATGLTVAASRTIDGAAIGACANAVSEIGGGFYKITLAAADTNGDMIGYKMTATDAQPNVFSVVTQV